MDYNFEIKTDSYCLQLKFPITMLFAEVQNSLHKDIVYYKLAGPRKVVILKFLYSGVRNKISAHKFFVSYGYETWSLTTMIEHRIRAFENTVLRKKYKKYGNSNTMRTAIKCTPRQLFGWCN